MKIAVNINGQFKKMTGIHQYVDSLMGALYRLETPHEITAFASGVWSRDILDAVTSDQRFSWRSLPKARVDMAGSDFNFARLLSGRRGAGLARRLDADITPRIKGRSNVWRTVRATRRYDLMHIPDAHILDFLNYQPKHFVATIYDVTTLTCPWAHNEENIATWARYYEFVKARCARVLTISEFSKADIVTHLGIPADRVDVTPLAARASAARVTDVDELRAVREKFGLGDAPFALYAGTLEPRKNLRRLVEAFAQATHDAPLTGHRLVLAGGHWADHDRELRELAASLGVGPRVVLTGYVSNAEMNALMSSCAAFAYVSEYEGFGLPPLEAMVCGAPVVASNTTSLPEVVGGAGLLVDPMDVAAIAGALHTLLVDAEENQRRRALSLARAEEFSWERTARLTVQSYEAAVS